MELDSVFVGQFLFVFAIIIGVLSYLLGRKKTTSPVLTGIVGFLTAMIPPIGLIFIAVIALKDNLKQ
ncbi:hypothetical protein Q4506_17240 [Colwellia sp. 4_MG-2023]|uniref:hypothetical protein n=1 Tax=unclassified Colwellia TaxID=196834 RepID=UPI0026E3A3E2|nr:MULTISPECIES: hypothetical protein [unclassified Colwellia]MDO6508757.1 hypothetical protein [Colwellia sp. 5_MG-2023]MDO6557422.1 hypothetical protein [Colwellia sp. 4_MG-2023]